MVCRLKVDTYWNAATLSFSYTAIFKVEHRNEESSEQMADIDDPAQIIIS